MGVRTGPAAELIAEIAAAPRAVVCLTVEWSTPERVARAAFRAAAAELSAAGVPCFVLDEDADECQAWLGQLGAPGLGEGYSVGAGSLLWLTDGRLVASRIDGCGLKAKQIAAHSLVYLPGAG